MLRDKQKISLVGRITWFCILILCITWGITILIVRGDRQIELTRAGNETANLANVLGKHVQATFSQIETSLFSMRKTWEAGISHEGMCAIMHRDVSSRPDLFNLLSIIDANGNVIVTDQGPASPTFSGDRPFFAHHRDNADRGMSSFPPVLGRVTGKWYIPLGVRLEDAQGRFAGVLLASVNPYHFSMIFREVDLGKASLIYFANSDGIIFSGMFSGTDLDLARRLPREEGPSRPYFSGVRTESGPTPLDGIVRIKSFAPVKDREMFVTVSVGLEESLKRSRSRTYFLAGTQLLFSVFVFLFLFHLRRAVLSRDAFSRELEGMKQRMDITMQATHITVFDIDVRSKQVNVTPALFELLGYSEDSLPRSLDEAVSLIHRDDLAGIRQTLEIGVSTGHVFRPTEFRAKRRKEGWSWASATGVILSKDSQGNPLQIMGVVWDINDRKLAEEDLRDSEQRLSFAFSAAEDGLWDWNIPLNRLFFSPRYYTMLGYEPGEFPASVEFWRGALHPDEREEVRRKLYAYLAESEPRQYRQEYRLRMKDGSWKWVLSRGQVVSRSASGAPVRMAGTHVDISARMAAEASLRASEENLRVTLNSIGDAVIATGTDGKITRMNMVAERLTGWQAEDALGRPIADVLNIVSIDSRQRTPCPVARSLAANDIVSLPDNTVLIDRGGREHRVADSGAPIRNARGEMLGVVLVLRDVTEEIALQEQLRQVQKMDAVGQLAGGVAHDFNNMLGGIMGAAELLELQLSSDSKQRELLRMILESSQRAAKLTSQLLAFSRKKVVSLDRIDIHKPLRDTFSIIEHTVDKRIRVTGNLYPDEPTVLGDHSQLQNAFLNVLINAAHAMPEGGNIVVSTREVHLDAYYCDSSPFKIIPGEYVEVEIRDSGCGIPPEIQPRIFEPFFTTKDQGKGTGLGLAAVYGIVQQHKGAINVYSEVGIGTCIHILLPKVETGAPAERKPVPVPIRGSGLILVVDDEPALRTTAGTILEKLGYQILLAEDGCQATRIYEENKERIDLVLLDMVMPEMNGRDCFMAMKAIHPAVRVVLSSGFTRDEDISAMKAAGLKGFIRKPFRSMELSQVVHAALSG